MRIQAGHVFAPRWIPSTSWRICGKWFLKSIFLYSRECEYKPRMYSHKNWFPKKFFVLVLCRGVCRNPYKCRWTKSRQRACQKTRLPKGLELFVSLLIQKTREGCGCCQDPENIRGFSGKTLGRRFPNRTWSCGILGIGKGKPAANLGWTLPWTLSPPSVRGVFLRSSVTTFSFFLLKETSLRPWKRKLSLVRGFSRGHSWGVTNPICYGALEP